MSTNLYKKNYLKNVIFRLDFVITGKNLDNIMDKSTIDIIKNNFKHFEPVKPVKNTNIQFDVATQQTQIHNEEITSFVFHKLDGSATLTITPNCLIIDYRQYSEVKTLKDDVKMLDCIIPKISINRTGLRYVNYIDKKEFGEIDWSKYIKDELLCSKDINTDERSKLLQTITVADYKYPNCFLKFQYGIHNQNFPGDCVKDAYILDFDASSNEINSEKEMIDTIQSWNDIIRTFFEDVIKDELKGVLNEKSELQ